MITVHPSKKLVHVYDPIYFVNLFAYFSVDQAKVNRLAKHHGFDTFTCDGWFARTLLMRANGGSRAVLLFKPDLDLATLTHEAFHAVSQTLVTKIALTDNNDEAYAYLLGYYTGGIMAQPAHTVKGRGSWRPIQELRLSFGTAGN